MTMPAPIDEPGSGERPKLPPLVGTNIRRLCTDVDAMPMPCPRVECRYHLATDAHYRGEMSRTTVKQGTTLHYSPVAKEQGLDGMPETCALEVAERGEHSLVEIGKMLGFSRERARQVEENALRRLGVLARIARVGS